MQGWLRGFQPRTTPISNDFKTVGTKKDARLGTITLMQELTHGELVFAKEQIATNETEFVSLKKECTERLEYNNPYRVEMLDYSYAIEADGINNKVVRVKQYFRFPEYDMEQEIQHRREKGFYYNGQELLQCAYQILLGLAEIHENLESHDNLRPCFIEREEGTFFPFFRLIDPPSNQNVLETHQKYMERGSPLYCSPQIFYCTLSGEMNIGDTRKNDAFSLGLCLLEAGTLLDIQQIYDPNSKLINPGFLSQYIAKFSERYEQENPLLCQIVEFLLTISVSDRPTPKTLLDALPKYQTIVESTTEEKLKKLREEYLAKSASLSEKYKGMDKERNTRLNIHMGVNETVGMNLRPQDLIPGFAADAAELKYFQSSNNAANVGSCL